MWTASGYLFGTRFRAMSCNVVFLAQLILLHSEPVFVCQFT